MVDDADDPYLGAATMEDAIMGEGDEAGGAGLGASFEDWPDDDKVDARRGGEDPPFVPKKDRSGLISRGSTPALGLPKASSRPSGAPSSTSRPPETEPRRRLSGFKLGQRPLEPAAADQ